MKPEIEKQIDEWESQTPIPIDRHELTPIPADSFQGWLGEMVSAVSDQLESPIELAGFLGMAAVATSLQGKYSLLIEPGYFEPLNIWAMVAMCPSNRKSSALKAMAGPIMKYELEQLDSLKGEIQNTQSVRKTLEAAIGSRRTKAGKLPMEKAKAEAEEIARLESELPQVPTVPRLLVNDCTPEQVAVLMQRHNERISFIDSEADALFAMMLGRYSDSPKLDVYLKAYSGDVIRVDRRNGPPIALSHPLITLGIAPQPGLIQDLVTKPALVNRGLLSRFIFAIPKSRIGYRVLKPTRIPEAVQFKYEHGLRSLLNSEAFDQPHIVRLSEFAYEIWKAFQTEVEVMMRPDGRLADSTLKAWGGKLAGNTARVAALLHASEVSPDHLPNQQPIDHDAMARAVNMMRVLIDHAIAAHDLAITDSDRGRAIQTLQWIKRSGKQNLTIRMVQQSLKQRADFRTADEVRGAFRVLEENGWLLRMPSENGVGRPTANYLVHPEMYPQNPQNG